MLAMMSGLATLEATPTAGITAMAQITLTMTMTSGTFRE